MNNKTFKVALSVKAKNGIIFQYIKENNITIKQLASFIGVSANWLSSVLCFNYVPKHKTESVNKLLEFFGCSFEEMFPTQKLKFLKGDHYTYQEIPKEKLLSWEDEQLKCLPDKKEIDLNKLDDELEKTLSTLKKREKYIIKLRYGIGCKNHTLEEIGKIIGVSRGRVGQIESRALRKLRHPGRSKKLIEYVDYIQKEKTNDK